MNGDCILGRLVLTVHSMVVLGIELVRQFAKASGSKGDKFSSGLFPDHKGVFASVNTYLPIFNNSASKFCNASFTYL